MHVDLTSDHFSLFGLDKTFAVDTEALQKSYRELQQALHPDRYASASAAERRWSVQAASLVNDAYTTLRSPLPRAVYLLSLSGVDIDEETDTRMDPMFLMEQMELRESLEAAPGKPDPMAALDGLRAELGRMEARSAERFEQALSTDDTVLARTEARQWQFLDKLRREANRVEARLDV